MWRVCFYLSKFLKFILHGLKKKRNWKKRLVSLANPWGNKVFWSTKSKLWWHLLVRTLTLHFIKPSESERQRLVDLWVKIVVYICVCLSIPREREYYKLHPDLLSCVTQVKLNRLWFAAHDKGKGSLTDTHCKECCDSSAASEHPADQQLSSGWH